MQRVLLIAQIFQGFAAPVIAVFVAYIALQQWKGNRLKLLLDRYERRLRVYQAVVEFITVACRDFKPEISEVGTFARGTAEADFLFPPDIRSYINELLRRALDSRAAHLEYRDSTQRPWPEHYDHQKTTAKMHEHELWLVNQHDVALERFRPYLDVSADP